jgi:hypothetical protein
MTESVMIDPGGSNMAKDPEWVFEKAIELTAATMAGRAGQGQPAEYIADVFRAAHGALKEASEGLTDRRKPGF